MKIFYLTGFFTEETKLKWGRIMRLTLFLMVGFILTVSARSYSQSTRLDIKVANGTIGDLIAQIEKNSEFVFLYRNDELDLNKQVTIDLENATIQQVLDTGLKSQDIAWDVHDRQIILRKSNNTEAIKQVQQQKTITGVVTDQRGLPLPGVTIVVKGTTTGTVTTADGNFSLTIPNDAETLQFTFIGMRTQEISIDNRTTITVVMEEESIGIEEVVAVGYGVQSRRSITSSVSSVDMEEAIKLPTSSIAQALSGRAAGLTTSIESAQPGGKVNLQIRGGATGREPLIVIDGMPTATPTVSKAGSFGTGSFDAILSTINPNDIERIDILKDASATSIYGSKAAGGVILITTKKGKYSGSPDGVHSISFNASMGTQEFTRLPEMLNAVQYMEISNQWEYERWLYLSRMDVYSDVSKPSNWQPPSPYNPYYSESQIQQFKTGEKTGTDWLSHLTESGLLQDYSLSLTGSHKNTRYYTSLSLFDQEGVIINNELQKYTGRVKVEQDFGDKLTSGVNLTFSHVSVDNVPIGDGQVTERAGILMSAMKFMPTVPVFDEFGNYSINPRSPANTNPVSFRELDNINKVERFFSTLYFNYKMTEDLSIKLQGGIDRNQNSAYSYIPSSIPMGASVGGQADRTEDKNNSYQLQSLLNYGKTFGDKHNVTALLGMEYMKYNRESLSINAKTFPFDGALWNNLRLGTATPIVWSTAGNSELISYFTRINYNLDYTYFITANFRIDGSSNFSPEHQYGFFPGVSLGWDIARYYQDSDWFNQFKLRVGYGETGNDQIGVAFFDWYTPGRTILWGDNIVSGIGLAGLGNPDLKWEKQVDLNAGVDFSFFDNRFSGGIDVFNRVISRILGNKNLGSWNRVNSISYNLDAEKQTYGAELALNIRNVETTNFSWNTALTFTYYRDRWLKRDPSYVLAINESPKQFFNEIWRYKSDGIVQVGEYDEVNKVPGSVRIIDQDSYLKDEDGARIVDENGKPLYAGEPDGYIDEADLVKVGVNTPFTIGFNNVLRYGQFDLSLYTYGVFNVWKQNPTFQNNPDNLLTISWNQQVEALDNWAHNNQDGKYPGVSNAFITRGGGDGDFYLEDAWFIRLRNVTLGYSFPKFNGLRIYGNIMNPFLITPYSGVDPETDAYRASYPNYRTYSLGIQANF